MDITNIVVVLLNISLHFEQYPDKMTKGVIKLGAGFAGRNKNVDHLQPSTELTFPCIKLYCQLFQSL